MSLQVWFSDDIRNTLLALAETALATHREANRAPKTNYLRGYMAAMHGVSVAFGINEPRLLLPPGTGAIDAENGTP